MTAPTRRVRPATPADLDALLLLEESSFTSDRISRRQWRRHLDSSSASVVVADGAAGIEAAAVLFHRRGARRARLYSLAVVEASRGRGLASALLAAAESVAANHGCIALSLEVRADNAAAISLYESRGFQPGIRLPGYYPDGMDGRRYSKPLTTITR